MLLEQSIRWNLDFISCARWVISYLILGTTTADRRYVVFYYITLAPIAIENVGLFLNNVSNMI